MADEKKLEDIVAEPAPVSGVQDDELKKKEEQKANLDKAIKEANDELRRKREELKRPSEVVEDNVPQIDLNDPSAKAWDKHIRDNTAPLSSQIEKQKDEVRTFALRRFLADKPALARNPEKLKEIMSTYDRIKVATEQTQEGVLMDLDRAYGATFHEELIAAARGSRLDTAKDEMIASDIAISRGATSEPSKAPVKRQLSADEQQVVAQWERHGAPRID